MYEPPKPHRTPYNTLPITLVLTTITQKSYRRLHCLECGKPFLDITDKVATATEGAQPIEDLRPNALGFVEPHCRTHTCKQYYRIAL